MQDFFYRLADALTALLRGNEVFTCTFASEVSDFVRFNQSRVRQAGHVIQHSLTLDFIEGRRHAAAELTLSGNLASDCARLNSLVQELRAVLTQVPEDPFLHYASGVSSSERHYPNTLPAREAALENILAAGQGRDLVGIYAGGAIHTGFANSLGQRNWYTRHSFNLDWSFYQHADKAIKTRYAGFIWQEEEFQRRVTTAVAQLEALARPAQTLAPGFYRAYLAPMALDEIMDLLGWDGFGLRAHRTGISPLLRMTEQDARLHPALIIKENTSAGLAPDFQSGGFIRPPQVTLIDNGTYQDSLVSPRSAIEFNVAHNGADASEEVLSLDIAPGTIALEDVLPTLDTGLYIGNLWYLNYSDRNSARLTGMTRFATFWVNNGRIQGPVNALRFDDTLYHLLGDRLLGLTAERELLLDPSSYAARSSRSARLPGALVEEMQFTL